jgi:hypothetical protein
MNLDLIYCGDLESDGLMDEITKIHVFSYGHKKDGDWSIGSTNNYDAISRFFTNPSNVIAIHNGKRFDGPALEKILGIKIKATIIDTLALAWYIDCGRPWNEYKLEWYGEYFGVPKPEVTDWVGLSYDQYKHRCETDTRITIKVWEKLLAKLRRVYDTDEDIIRIIKYLNFIMECSYMQEVQKVEVDLEKVKSNLAYFESLKEEKVSQLKQAMPKIPIFRTVKRPESLYKKDGNLSVAGQKWLDVIKDDNHPFETVDVVVGYEEPNPNSVPQKKAWLYSLGWVPQTFAYKRNKETGEVKKIEQILTDEKMLCPSVLKLKEKEPAIELLDGISVLSHRTGLFKGLLENHKDGFVVQGLVQLAVTLRWQHSQVVNYPKVSGKGDIRDGKWIRECLIAGKGKKIVQSDLSGIESRTSDHYTFPINPDRIAHTQQKFFDPHTEVAVVANLMTSDEEVWFKWKKENKERKSQGLPELPIETFGSLSSSFVETEGLMDKLKEARHKAKTTNYSSLYGVTPPTLSRNLNIPEKEAKKLIQAYWKIHYAVKEVTKTFDIKKVDDELWILNPISRFRHNLRHEKDAFSTTNQSSAVYCFNMWLYNITKQGYWPIMQCHDDLAIRCDEKDADKVKRVINKAMEQLNKQLKLNVPLACEVQVGDRLSETH